MSSSPSPSSPRRGFRWETCALYLVAAAIAVSILLALRSTSSAPPSVPGAARPPVLSTEDLAHQQEVAYRQVLTEAQTALAAGQRDRAAERLDSCDRAQRRWEWYVLRRLCVEAPPAVTLGSTDDTARGFLSRDGRRAAFLYKPSQNGTSLHVFDTADGRQVMEVPQRPGAGADPLDFLTLSTDGRRLGLGTADRTRIGWEKVPVLFDVPARPGWPPVPYMGRPGVIVGSVDREVHQTTRGFSLSLDVLTREMLEKHDGGTTAAAYSPDGRLMARGDGNTVTLVEGKKESHFEATPGSQLVRLAFSPDGRRLAAGFSDGSAVVWDVKTRKPLCWPPLRVEVGGIGIQLEVKDGGITVHAVLNGTAAGKDGTIKAGDRILAVSGPDGKMVPMDGDHLAEFTQLCRGQVGKPVVLKVRQGDQEKTVTLVRTPIGNLPVVGLAFSQDGRRLAVNALGSAAVWDLESRQDLEGKSREAIVHGIGWAMAFTPDGRLLADREGTLIGVDAAGNEICTVPGLGHAIVDMTCLHDGRLGVLARAGRDLKYYQLSAAALDDQPTRRAGPEGDRRQAIRDLTAQIDSGKEKDPKALARLYRQRGLLLGEEGDYAASKADFEAAIKLDGSLAKP